MGIAAGQFFAAGDSEKETLSRRIVPTDDQMADQQERWDALAEHMRSRLSEISGYSVRHWLQGSYKFHTQIRPAHKGQEFDIDLGIYYLWDGLPGRGLHSPLRLKNFVQESLLMYQQQNTDDVIEITAPKERCCRIRFQDAFHIDVPCYHLDPSRDARALATQKNQWENSDPKALYQWFQRLFTDDDRAIVRRQIRYFKAWAALKFKEQTRPSSVLLTVLVAEAMIGADFELDDDEMFSGVSQRLVQRLEADRTVRNPVNSYERLDARLEDEQFAGFISGLKTLSANAERGSKTDDLLTACDIWTEVFEHLFPVPPEQEIRASRGGISTSRALTRVAFNPEITIRAVSKDNANLVWNGANRIGPIPKNCSIEFRMANAASLPTGAQVRWVVRNEGDEAARINDLGHLAGEGLARTESSAYNGTHYMDCMVRLHGEVIGLRRIPVLINGPAVPRRNPLKRPNWTQFNRRR